jgi:hypothetical protein
MPNTPDPLDLDSQDDMAEVFDETHLNEDAEFATLEDLPDVYDATRALGDARDYEALDADEYDPKDLDDEDLEEDEDVDDALSDELEDVPEDDELEDEDDLDAEDGVDRLEWDEAQVQAVADVDQDTDLDEDESDVYESSGELSDEDLVELGYKDAPAAADGRGSGASADDVRLEADAHQDQLLDEGVEETFPASDPVSVKSAS